MEIESQDCPQPQYNNRTLTFFATQMATYEEHLKRVWSVDFSQTDPTRFLSGSDDGTVRLWSLNDAVRAACFVYLPCDSPVVLQVTGLPCSLSDCFRRTSVLKGGS